jgi:hypothetical protein
MELVIVPNICKPQKSEDGLETAPSFQGSITIDIPSTPELYRFRSKYGRKMNLNDMANMENKTEQAFATMDLIGEICEEIKPKILKVDLIEVSTKREIKSVEDLYCYEPVFGAVTEIGMKFIQGFAEKN